MGQFVIDDISSELQLPDSNGVLRNVRIVDANLLYVKLENAIGDGLFGKMECILGQMTPSRVNVSDIAWITVVSTYDPEILARDMQRVLTSDYKYIVVESTEVVDGNV